MLTRVPLSLVRDLPKLDLPWATKPVYCDSPDIVYYLGHDALYQTAHPLNAVLNPDISGIFIFIPNHDYGAVPGFPSPLSMACPCGTASSALTVKPSMCSSAE